MIDKAIKIELEKHGELDFKPLYDVMEKSGLTFIDQRLHVALGIATFDKIYLDMEKICRCTDVCKLYVVFHEMAHGIRIKKFGKQWVIDKLSLEDFEEFLMGVVEEEIIADRYACYMVHKLWGVSVPREMTQQLHLAERQDQYRSMINGLFGKVCHSEENYDKLFNTFLITS